LEATGTGSAALRGEVMTEHRLFYYPYATMFNAQLPLLKTAALFFDKLVLLDPRDATWDRIGPEETAWDEVLLLEQHGLLERVEPAAVLERYGPALKQAIQEDIRNPDFMRLCDEQARRSGRHIWSLALAKLPDNLLADQQVRSLFGEVAPSLAEEMGRRLDDYIEHREALSYLPGNEGAVASPEVLQRAADYHGFASNRNVFDEVRYDSAGHEREYRYIEVPLALGEAIMVNHAIFAGLVLSEATPIADEPFHSAILAHKVQRAASNPHVREVLEDRARQRGMRTDLFASAALVDADLDLPTLDPSLPVEAILEYRDDHAAELSRVRAHLAALARRIENDPWSVDFANELERKTIPDLVVELNALRKQRDDWVNRKRKQGLLTGAGLAAGTSAAVLSVLAAPITPIALVIAGLSLVSGTGVPGAAWWNSWREGKAAGHENGLTYLLRA
jgi:hypothetical protein